MPTEPWDDEDRIGVPVAGLASRGVAPPGAGRDREVAPPGSPDDEPELRAGDTHLGRPAQVSASVKPLSDDDRRRLREVEEAQALRELAEAEEVLASDPTVVRWAGWFAHPLAAAFLLGTAGALGLFLYAQVLNLLTQLAAQPVWVQYAGYTALGLLALAVLSAMFRLLLLYVRLRRNRQIRLKGLEELETRTRLRWLAAAKTLEAKGRLEQYLREYPIQTDKERKALARVGVTAEVADELARVRDELLDPARYASAGVWFERFREAFQAKLDEAAAARISYWSNRGMLVTAISPNALVDGLSTTYFGFALLADLCQVYNLKAGRTGTAVLLGRVFFSAYLSGQLHDFEKLAEEQYDHVLEQGFQVVGVGVGSNVATKLMGKVGAKVTSGYLNRILLSRLGRYACRLLRPVSRD